MSGRRILFVGLLGSVVGGIAGLVLGYGLGFFEESLPRLTSGMAYENVLYYMVITTLIGIISGPFLSSFF